MRDSFIHDSFMEDTLLSVWDQLSLALPFTSSEEACSEEQHHIVSRRWSVQCDGCVFGPLRAIGTHFVLDCLTQAVVVEESFPSEQQSAQLARRFFTQKHHSSQQREDCAERS